MPFQPAEWTGEEFALRIEDGPLAAPLDVSGRLKSAKLTGSAERIDRTAGPNRKHKQSMPGIQDRGLEITFNVLASDINPGWLRMNEVYTITLGFPDLSSGNNGHKQQFWLSDNPIEIMSGTHEVQYKSKWIAYDEPTVDFFAGETLP